MYKSPVELITKQTNTQIEEHIFNVIQEVAVNVDKEELIKALQYDRNQYEQGYMDGKLSNKWISVNDRLPDERINCLVYYKHSYCEDDGYWAIGVSFYDKNEFHLGLAYKVTHWMPLPELPKED